MSLARIDAAQWVAHFAELQAQGLVWFDFLTAIDRSGQLEVVARVADSTQAQSALVATLVTDEIDSLTGLFPGAAWHERETMEMFGLAFLGLADARPLLLGSLSGPPPLRKASRA